MIIDVTHGFGVRVSVINLIKTLPIFLDGILNVIRRTKKQRLSFEVSELMISSRCKSVFKHTI